MILVTQTECLGSRVVTAVEAIVDHHTHAEACAEGVAEEVAVDLGRAEFGEFGIDFGKDAADGLAVGKEVTVIVDKHGDSEFLFKERTEGHTIAERGEIGEIAADNAVGIVGRAGERKADCHRFLVEFIDNLLKPLNHSREAEVKVVGIGGHGNRINNKVIGLHGAEHKVCAAGIEGDYNAFVKLVHNIIRFR